jgi:DNA-binding NarL/FixJ family response regulator
MAKQGRATGTATMKKVKGETLATAPATSAAPAPAPQPSKPKAISKSRVLLIDDHPIVRERLAELINQEDDLMVCGEAEDAFSAMEAIDKTVPDICLVDISLKDSYGIELVKDIKAQHAQVKTLVLSMHDESLYAERALRAGARGYMTKQEASKKVIGAIRQVLGGGIYVSDKMAGVLLGRVAGEPRSDGSPIDRLSDRELEIFQLLGEGLAVREIAKRLHVSVKTVEAHRTHIKEKLNIKTSPELLRYAIQTSLNEQK